MAFQIGCTSDGVTLELDGDNSVKHAAELHQQLLAAGAQNKAVTVKAQRCGSIDITVIQILAALQDCCPEMLIERPSEEFLSSLDSCAMRRHVRAALRQDKRGEDQP
jgi:ABC-type transporter Mla MlaB component